MYIFENLNIVLRQTPTPTIGWQHKLSGELMSLYAK